MIVKILFFVLSIILVIVGAFYVYNFAPGEPIQFEILAEETEVIEETDFGPTPLFLENLRFEERNISYFIEDSCSRKRAESMIEAFRIFEEEVGVLNFYEVFSGGDSKIVISCSKEEIELGDSLFAAGEGGPSKIINTSKFNIIQKGQILIYKDQTCERPIVEIHELGHVLGFNHSMNPKSIMYNVSKCEQRITLDMIEAIERIYVADSIPDASIEEISAIKRGGVIDFNITITNIGLNKIENISLDLVYDGKIFETFYLEDMGIGYGRTLSATSIRLPSRNVEVVNFVVDKNNELREIDEDNNLKTLYISPK